MSELQRLTTEYVDTEDRLRLTGEGEQGQTIVLWLTQRLSNRLLPHLCRVLEQAGGAAAAPSGPVPRHQALQHEIAQSFAQQAAAAALKPQPPVQPAQASAEVLVHSVDVSVHEAGVNLKFKTQAPQMEQPSELSMTATALRQWLGIIYAQYRKAEWPTSVWPQWMEEASRPATAVVQPQKVSWH